MALKGEGTGKRMSGPDEGDQDQKLSSARWSQAQAGGRKRPDREAAGRRCQRQRQGPRLSRSPTGDGRAGIRSLAPARSSRDVTATTDITGFSSQRRSRAFAQRGVTQILGAWIPRSATTSIPALGLWPTTGIRRAGVPGSSENRSRGPIVARLVSADHGAAVSRRPEPPMSTLETQRQDGRALPTQSGETGCKRKILSRTCPRPTAEIEWRAGFRWAARASKRGGGNPN